MLSVLALQYLQYQLAQRYVNVLTTLCVVSRNPGCTPLEMNLRPTQTCYVALP